MSRQKIVFLGSGAFGVPTLEWLASEHELAAVVTQPDRPAGRGGQLRATPVGAWTQEHSPSVALHKPDRIRDLAETLADVAAPLWVVIAYGQKLPRAMLDTTFAINLHASLLPRWRGAAPINAAIMAGDAQIGNSVITLADRMDAGDVLAQLARDRDVRMTAAEAHDMLAADGPSLIRQVLDAFSIDSITRASQDESLVTLAPKIGRSDAWIDFGSTAASCRDRIHALSPRPGITVSIGSRSIKLLRAEVVGAESKGETGTPGILRDAEQGIVFCGQHHLRLVEIQPAGKRAMPWSQFVRGQKIEKGTALCAEVQP